jgi:uncharacterized protein YutE (UPF0331/DUF86 family)
VKFVILHLANAIELILKDKVIDAGSSIYKGSSTITITIWEAFSILNNVNIVIPERPVIQLLIDDRNTIQHRFGFPNGDAVFYYLDQVLRFFRRFLMTEYSVDVVELLRLYVAEEHLVTIGLVERDDEIEPLNRLFAVSPEAAVLQAYSLVERKILQKMDPDDEMRRPGIGSELLRRVLRRLLEAGVLSRDDLRRFDSLRQLRNRAAHAADFSDTVPMEAWQTALNTSKRLIQAIDEAAKTGILDELIFAGRRRNQVMELQADHNPDNPGIEPSRQSNAKQRTERDDEPPADGGA